MTIRDCRPGQRVRIIQQIDRREGAWRAAVEGIIEFIEEQKTGSWYAHSKDGKYWLLRVRLRKPDGELTTVNVDPLTRVEILQDAPAN